MAKTTESESINATHPPSAGHWINGVVWALIGLAAAFLGLRLFCKYKRRGGLWLDDYVLMASWLVLIAAGGILSICVAAVFFDHYQDNHMGGHDVGLLTTITGTLFFIAAIWSKTSFAITLTRIAGPKLKIALYMIITSMNVVTCVSVILRWLQCHPTRMIWDTSVKGTCWNRDLILGVTIAAAAYSAFMDFLLAIMPWHIIIKLQMRPREKIGIMITMSMGICAGITAIVKCTKFQVLKSTGFADDVFELSIWSVAEIATTIMAASIPMLRSLVREATAIGGGLGSPVLYIIDKSRGAASRMRSRHASLTASRRSKMMERTSNTASEEKAALSQASAASGQIVKMEEVHIHFTDRAGSDSIESEIGRLPRSYSPWV
ncbi:hypothetical protein F4818DRAFT_1432 [Hypoxylon cercidicola]|nr:hypothetical protein F4818DRAFT_1432 [Hypoxylon cercidicola]